MKVFDFRFSPRRKDIAFYCSYFQPKNEKTNNLGTLFIVGEISNAFSKDKVILNQLADEIKEEFYQSGQQADEQFKKALRRANKFLANLANQGNINWLGNLNFAVLNINDFNLQFSKTGNIKILLQRGREFLDISENLEFQHLPFSSLEKFSTTAIGRLSLNDRLYILTSQVADLFSNEDLLSEFLEISELKFKTIKGIIKQREEFKRISGIFLLVLIDSFRKKQFKIPLPTRKIDKRISLVLYLILLLLVSYLIFKFRR